MNALLEPPVIDDLNIPDSSGMNLFDADPELACLLSLYLPEAVLAP